jgi:cytochrome c553
MQRIQFFIYVNQDVNSRFHDVEKLAPRGPSNGVASRQRHADDGRRAWHARRRTALMDKRKRSARPLLPGSTGAGRNGSGFHCYPWNERISTPDPKPMRTFPFFVAALFAAPGTALAQATDARALAAGCASCHRSDGSTIPSLHARSREALVAELRAFRDGSRSGTVMPQLARGYTDAQLEAIATWYAAQRKDRE